MFKVCIKDKMSYNYLSELEEMTADNKRVIESAHFHTLSEDTKTLLREKEKFLKEEFCKHKQKHEERLRDDEEYRMEYAIVESKRKEHERQLQKIQYVSQQYRYKQLKSKHESLLQQVQMLEQQIQMLEQQPGNERIESEWRRKEKQKKLKQQRQIEWNRKKRQEEKEEQIMILRSIRDQKYERQEHMDSVAQKEEEDTLFLERQQLVHMEAVDQEEEEDTLFLERQRSIWRLSLKKKKRIDVFLNSMFFWQKHLQKNMLFMNTCIDKLLLEMKRFVKLLNAKLLLDNQFCDIMLSFTLPGRQDY